MLIYDTIDQANQAEGIHATPQGESSPGKWAEADWGYRLRGQGLPGGGRGGWLLTYIFNGAPFSPSPSRTGTLIAYEIINDTKTGRVAILRRDWTGALDEEWIQKVQASPEWKLNDRNDSGEDDIDRIDNLLPGPTL